jgi:hypothetical protein
VFRRALEHHVLEHVGEPGAAHDLVARADLVPDLHGDDRRLGGFDQQHLHAVGELVFLDFQREGGQVAACQEGADEDDQGTRQTGRHATR